jgi:hypothetical protein
LAHDLNHCHRQYGNGHDPQVLPEIPEAANGIDCIHDESREVSLFATQSTVHRRTDDLGLEHICKGGHTGSQDGDKKVPFRAFKELPQERDVFPLLRTFLGVCHFNFSPFEVFQIFRRGAIRRDLIKSKDAKRAQASACALTIHSQQN